MWEVLVVVLPSVEFAARTVDFQYLMNNLNGDQLPAPCMVLQPDEKNVPANQKAVAEDTIVPVHRVADIVDVSDIERAVKVPRALPCQIIDRVVRIGRMCEDTDPFATQVQKWPQEAAFRYTMSTTDPVELLTGCREEGETDLVSTSNDIRGVQMYGIDYGLRDERIGNYDERLKSGPEVCAKRGHLIRW